jgi:acyl-CoA hydrolase
MWPWMLGGRPERRSPRHNTHCIIIHVAVNTVNTDGEPVAVPTSAHETDEDRAQEQYAMRLMELRKGIEDEMRAHQT